MGDALAFLVWLVPLGILVAVGAKNWHRGDRSVPPPHPGAQWAPDPTRRHELRLWDGTQWTANVSTRGISGWDPLQ